MDTNPTTETPTPPTARRWWRPQFTIVQMLLALMIVAMCAANWLLRRDIEKIRHENRFYREFVEFDLTQIGSCSVKETVRDLNLPDNLNLMTKDYEITLVLNPQKSYKLSSNYGKLNSVSANSVNSLNPDCLYISKQNKHVVVKIFIENAVSLAYPQHSTTKYYGHVSPHISYSLYEFSSNIEMQKFLASLSPPYDVIRFDGMQYLATVKYFPIKAGVHDLSKPLSLLSITDSTDEPENSEGLQIWLQEE